MRLPAGVIMYTILLVLFLVKNTNSGVLAPVNQDAQQIGLYSTTDDLTILTAANFNDKIYNSNRIWFVEFYNTWCGHCQRFAPSWKALATDIKEWQDKVTVGVLDCANDQNYPLCRDFEIMAYPTLKYFHENYVKSPENLGEKVEAGFDLKQHREHLLRKLVSEQWNGRAKILPNLLPYNYSDSSRIFQGIPEDTNYVFLIIQEPESFLGHELTLDLHKINSFAIRYAFNNNTHLLNELHVEQIPSLVAFKRNKKPEIIPVTTQTRVGLQTAIRAYLLPENINVPFGETRNIFNVEEAQVPDMSAFIKDKERQALKERIKKMGDVVFQVDLETVLRYSLKHEVGSVKELSGEKLKALQDYLSILVKYFPFGKYGHAFLNDLKSAVSNTESLKGEIIANMVVDAEKEERQVFSSPPQWLGCISSAPNKRRYPCGLWKMFHYLTVNAADHNRDLKNSNPREVLDAMHGYIKNFFGCSECSQHFQQMASRRELNKVDSWDNSILWLWKAHNEVNRRLAGDPTEDPEFPKQQFPIQERCTRCYNAGQMWNEVEVLNYLKHMYSSINVRYIGSDTRILHMGLEGSSASGSGSTVLHTIDTSMCFILYIASFTLILIIIRMFLKRGYRKKMYEHDILGKV